MTHVIHLALCSELGGGKKSISFFWAYEWRRSHAPYDKYSWESVICGRSPPSIAVSLPASEPKRSMGRRGCQIRISHFREQIQSHLAEMNGSELAAVWTVAGTFPAVALLLISTSVAKISDWNSRKLSSLRVNCLELIYFDADDSFCGKLHCRFSSPSSSDCLEQLELFSSLRKRRLIVLSPLDLWMKTDGKSHGTTSEITFGFNNLCCR